MSEITKKKTFDKDKMVGILVYNDIKIFKKISQDYKVLGTEILHLSADIIKGLH